VQRGAFAQAGQASPFGALGTAITIAVRNATIVVVVMVDWEVARRFVHTSVGRDVGRFSRSNSSGR
jgi:hypothetical protein